MQELKQPPLCTQIWNYLLSYWIWIYCSNAAFQNETEVNVWSSLSIVHHGAPRELCLRLSMQKIHFLFLYKWKCAVRGWLGYGLQSHTERLKPLLWKHSMASQISGFLIQQWDDSENKINKQTNQDLVAPGEIERKIKMLPCCEY